MSPLDWASSDSQNATEYYKLFLCLFTVKLYILKFVLFKKEKLKDILKSVTEETDTPTPPFIYTDCTISEYTFQKSTKLDRGLIRLSPKYGLSTPYRLTIRISAGLFHHVLFNMGDVHLVLLH